MEISKVCFKCNIDKPLSEYYKHPATTDGRLGKCKSCTKDDTKKQQTELYKFKFPWDLRLAYSLTYNNMKNQQEITTNSLMVSGNVDLAVKWKMGFSSGYDFAKKGITFSQLRFERDLESWRMSFSIVPIGVYSYWNFFIGIKSSMLSDIKWDKRKLPDPRLR